MKRFGFHIALIIPLIFAWAGCKGDEGPVGPNLKGDIYGMCISRDLTGIAYPNSSGTTAKIEERDITATSDSTGHFVLRGVPTGTYTLSFSKPGFATNKFVGVKFISGGDIWWGTTYIYELPHFTVTALSATPSVGNVSLTATLNGSFPTGNRYVRYFVSTSPTVSSDPNNYIFSGYIAANNTTTTASGSLSTATLNQNGIMIGQTIYIIAYPETYGVTSYTDVKTGKVRYTSAAPTPSNVVSVVVQ